MGNRNFSKTNHLEFFRKDIRPFDIVLFRGTDFVSDAIRWFQRRHLRYSRKNDFSHCGIVITSEVLDHPNILPGRFYVMESTISGRLGQGIPDIDGKSFLGVQIRDLEDLIPAYLNGKSQIAIGKLKNNPFESKKRRVARRKLQKFYRKYNHRVYDYNPINLSASIFSCMKPVKYSLEQFLEQNSDNLLFCSEMAAELYKEIGLLDSDVRADEVVPMDFIEKDRDGKIPEDFVDEIFLLNEEK